MNIFKPLDPRLVAELKTQKRPIAVGLTCVLLTSLLTGASIPLIKEIVDAITNKHVTAVGQLSLLIVAIYGAKYWFTRGQTYYLSRAANRLAANLRLKLFQKLQSLPVTYFNNRRTGAIQSILTNDVSIYQTAVTIIRDSLDGPIKAIVSFVAIFIMQWQLGLVAFIFLPVMMFVIQRNGKRMKAAQKQVQVDLATLNALTQEALQGTRVVKAFAAEERIESRYQQLVDTSFTSQMRATACVASLRPLVELIGASALALVLYICAVLVEKQQMGIGNLVALTYALDVINQGFRNLASVNNTYNQVQAAAERIYGEVLDIPEEHVQDRGNKIVPIPEGCIEFCNVSFSYPDGTEALRNVSFTLEAGQSLALVGPSGAGKSTIADLVLRFYDPTEGTILFDGIDIRDLKTSWLRSQIGVVPQHTFLFAGTIAENIRLGAPEATNEDLAVAANAAHAEGFISEMPERFETELGERGIRLSGGQMQRIAIARAVIRKPALLLLDEATSALDAESERAVQQALDEIMKERTTLFIAHRLTTAARADRILMLRRGEVVEQGSHKELMEAGGAYAAMYKAFSSGLFDETLG